MNTHPSFRTRGFTLLETVIAIGVLAVLLTGFMIVFAPAAAGIRKAINVQDADRLASTLEQELVTLRGTKETDEYKTGFEKAFDFIKEGNNSPDDALLLYKYRGSLSNLRPDNTPEPVKLVSNKLPGEDYDPPPPMRRRNDSLFLDDIEALEGSVFVVKCTQLVFENGELQPSGNANQIVDPKNPGTPAPSSDDYPEAVIAFSAEFYLLPAHSATYFNGRFKTTFPTLKSPIFTRNLAVRR
jgi:prepilin-type N-terminal cleavage/methylation domain-containing protein